MHEAPWSIYIIFNEDDTVYWFADGILEAISETERLTNKHGRNFYFERYELVEE